MKTYRISLCGAAILMVSFAVGAPLYAQYEQPQSAKPVAVKDEPHHHLLFENDYVRAWGFGIGGHDATLLHNHDLPYFGVALGAADFTNVVTGKPEANVKLTDGQVSYSKGGFSHLVRTETDTPFRNITIELLKPQGTPRNRCVKVMADAPVDCPTTSATQLDLATTLLFETDEVAVRSGEVSYIFRIAWSDAQPGRLLAVLEGSELSVELPGQQPKKVNGGEVLWLPPGAVSTLVNTAAKGDARFVLFTFKDSAAAK